MFEIVIQLAAILSVVFAYSRKFFDFRHYTFYLKLIVAVIPALIAGALLKKYIDQALDNLTFIACVMLAGGIILLFIDRLFTSNRITEEKNIGYGKAFAIGCFQVLSVVFPGLSRSAATIIGGMSQQLTRRLAAEFSFFLAVPTMLAASAKSFYDVYKEHPEALMKNNMSLLGIGGIISFVVALFTIRFFINFVQKHGFRLFGYYRIALGLLILILIFSGVIGR
jgi:undecaprenyl-diphosphatase